MGGFKDRIASVFKTNTPKQTVYERKETKQTKKLSKSKSENTNNPFISKKKKKEIKDRMIRDIWTLFQTEEQKKEVNK